MIIQFYQIAFNKIIDKLSRDQEYLEQILTPISEKDDFIKKLLIFQKKFLHMNINKIFNVEFLEMII